MTDRELLELAAKAAGIDGVYGYPIEYGCYGADSIGIMIKMSDFGDYEAWNSLSNRGDALELAVKLGITIAPGCVSWGDGEWLNVAGDSEEEYTIALLRAITSAAASMGKAMP